MTLSLDILLEGIGDGDGSVAEVLPVHRLDGSVRRLKAAKVDECKTFRVTRVWIPHDLKHNRQSLVPCRRRKMKDKNIIIIKLMRTKTSRIVRGKLRKRDKRKDTQKIQRDRILQQQKVRLSGK